MNAAGLFQAGPRRRLAVSLLIAAALHALVLSRVPAPFPRLSPTPLSAVTLTLGYDSPEQAPEPAPATVPGESPALVEASPETAVPDEAPPTLVPALTPPPSPLAGKTSAQLVRDVAALAALAEPRDGLPGRVYRLDVAARTSPEFAFYLEAWRRKVERIGNINYPADARAKGLNGSLRLLVTITAEGHLTEVRLLESSGHRILDDAALRIVRLAAPYAPFSPRMRESADVLEIERTWRFRNNRYSS